MYRVKLLLHSCIARRLLAASALLMTAAIAPVHASIPDADGVIHACRHKQSGALRVIDSADSCNGSSEAPLNWSQNGAASTIAYYVSNEYSKIGGDDTVLVSVSVPSGTYTITAK